MARKYGPKASEKIGLTMHEFKRGKLKSGGSGKKVTSRKQAIAIGISQARRAGYKVPPEPPKARAHATMKGSLDARVRAYLGKMRPGQEIDARGIARALGGGTDPLEADYALERAEKAGLAVTDDGRWFGPARASHATRKKYPYIAYWIRSRGPGSQRDSVPIYVLGTTSRTDEGIVGHDLRVRPLRLGKGSYTMVVSPDDVEDRP
jgi:hypothetical protein